MARRFDPRMFEERVIVVDLNVNPPLERMNCVMCGRMVEELWMDFDVCRACYESWSVGFCEEWLRARFGEM